MSTSHFDECRIQLDTYGLVPTFAEYPNITSRSTAKVEDVRSRGEE
jgi:hypothetical protein